MGRSESCSVRFSARASYFGCCFLRPRRHLPLTILPLLSTCPPLTEISFLSFPRLIPIFIGRKSTIFVTHFRFIRCAGFFFLSHLFRIFCANE